MGPPQIWLPYLKNRHTVATVCVCVCMCVCNVVVDLNQSPAIRFYYADIWRVTSRVIIINNNNVAENWSW